MTTTRHNARLLTDVPSAVATTTQIYASRSISRARQQLQNAQTADRTTMLGTSDALPD